MKRRVVRVIQCRIEDVEVGDVINRDPEALGGWFIVAEVSTLFNGETQFSDESANLTVTGFEYDIVGVQLLDQVTLDPETGLLATPEPAVVMAAPSEVAPGPVVVPDSVLAEEVAPAPAAAAEADPGPEQPVEPPAAAEIVPDFSAGPEVDLAKVADALASLDVGSEAPPARFEFETATPPPVAVAAESPDQATAAPADPAPTPADGSRRATDPESANWVRRSPDLPRVPMPEGAVPVYGDTLPESPSYLNPVVVREPDAEPLPKRRSAD